MVRVFFSYRSHEAKIKDLPRTTTAARLFEIIDEDDHLTEEFVVRRMRYGNVRLTPQTNWTLAEANSRVVDLDIDEYQVRTPDKLAEWLATSPMAQPIRNLGRYSPLSLFEE